MTFSMYDLSVPVLARGLTILSRYIEIAEEFVAAKGLSERELIEARLAPDMLPFSGQIQRASDTSKGVVGRLTTVKTPSFPDAEKTFLELKERIIKTVSFLQGVPPEEFKNAASKKIELSFLKTELCGEDYLLQFVVPNFFFHVTNAHDILRHNGVPIGKRDYLGSFE